MNAFLKAVPLAALIGAWGWSAEIPERPLEPAWMARDFSARLEAEAARAAVELRSEPDLAAAEVRVRSVDDHGPLQVEVEMEPTDRLSASRQESLLAGVRARFESFAVVRVIRTEAGR